MLSTFKIFRRISDHGTKFPKLSETSFSGIIYCISVFYCVLKLGKCDNVLYIQVRLQFLKISNVLWKLVKLIKVDMKWTFSFFHMKVHEKQEWMLLTISWYLIWFQRYQRLKEPKRATQNWFTANNNNSQNYDVIRFAFWLLSYKINYNSIITESNPLKLCKQKAAEKKCLILVWFWLSRQHSQFQAPLIQNNNSPFSALVEEMTFELLLWRPSLPSISSHKKVSEVDPQR